MAAARFNLEGISFPCVSLGTSPFLGAGQFGSRALDYYGRLYQEPGNMVEIIVRSIELGIEAINVIAYDRIIDAVIEAVKHSGSGMSTSLVIGLDDWERELARADDLECGIVFLHGQVADSGKLPVIEKMVSAIRAGGRIPGCATHNPARTIPFLDDSGVDMAVYMAPVNMAGKFMGREPGRALEVIRKTGKAVIGKKVLGAGTLDPVDALEYIGGIEEISGIAVGVASVQEADMTFPLANQVFKG
jgi:hypothetical protein